jgi:hypothetical protein
MKLIFMCLILGVGFLAVFGGVPTCKKYESLELKNLDLANVILKFWILGI